jgi:hypothetical protein
MQTAYDEIQASELSVTDAFAYEGELFTVLSIIEDDSDCIIVDAFSLTTGFSTELIFDPFDYVSLVEPSLED